MKKTEHYIAYPDKSWTTIAEWESLPAEHREKFGATCIRGEHFKQAAHRDAAFWNPVKIGERITIPVMHFIVWRHIYKTGRVSVTVNDKNQFEVQARNHPEDVEGAACVRAISVGQAEAIAQEDSFWNPVDEEVIRHSQEKIQQERAARRSHYPEAW